MENDNKLIHIPRYPIGTLIYYGPDDQTVTKISASVVLYEGAEPIKKSWTGPEVTSDSEVIREIGRFFKNSGAQRVVMNEHVEGCPHVEGVDYPLGEDCPHCPFWSKKK